eukprot:CAMPEP_0194505512 /NCGR_PEP_ID=MMETSP0253-20130528/32337_1 /TAXON_ID=2966 /ORGANISM="Noctiluca scintillans" /LENGTH=88 /DNA_ID=CAMNT_0039348075 /DNA_START=519 /DNA_END=782 /DNA_ORIENTATION=-
MKLLQTIIVLSAQRHRAQNVKPGKATVVVTEQIAKEGSFWRNSSNHKLSGMVQAGAEVTLQLMTFYDALRLLQSGPDLFQPHQDRVKV